MGVDSFFLDGCPGGDFSCWPVSCHVAVCSQSGSTTQRMGHNAAQRGFEDNFAQEGRVEESCSPILHGVVDFNVLDLSDAPWRMTSDHDKRRCSPAPIHAKVLTRPL